MSGHTFHRAPVRVYWELTRACDLACRHCRANAERQPAPDELDTIACERVIHDLASAGPPMPHVVFTGGDPFRRPDLRRLVRYAVARGLGVSVAPSATPEVTPETVRALRDAGVAAMSLSVDGATPARHDGLRGVLGCFGWTLVAAQRIVEAGIPLQVNTLVAAETAADLEEIAALVGRLGAARWSLFFLVATGRGRLLRALAPREAELTLRWLAGRAPAWPFTATTTEAPHFRRVVIERMRAAGATGAAIARTATARGFGIRDGNGIMFVAANGDVTPSGFLPLVVGNVRDASALALYREHPRFRALRAPDGFHGRCGVCRFRSVCGGSRARAYAGTGDYLASEPYCIYRPPKR